MNRICENCGINFCTPPSQVKSRGGKYCSRKCYDEARRTIAICTYCGEAYALGRMHRNNKDRKYCSISCKNLDSKKIIFTCLYCHNIFEDFPSRKRIFCSTECHDKYRTIEEKQIYPKEFRKIRVIILKESNYKCLICNEYGNNVHHINYNKKDCSRDNLVCLCKRCHGKTNINRKEWEERINHIIGCW